MWLNVETRLAVETTTLLITSSNRDTKVHVFGQPLRAGGYIAVIYCMSGRGLIGRESVPCRRAGVPYIGWYGIYHVFILCGL